MITVTMQKILSHSSSGENPHFQFWSIVLKFQMAYLLFLRSIRSNFLLYSIAMQKILPWMFSLNHIHYARWLTIHQFDMDALSKSNPEIFFEFSKNGNFVVSRTKNVFSSMGLDQRHEQLNKDIKGDGGMTGLTEDAE